MSCIKIDHVTVKFPRASKNVLEDLQLTVQPGEFIVLLGSNGSGKSSFLKLLMGDVVPARGRVAISPTFKRQYMGQSTADSLFHDLTVYENLVLHEHAEGASLWKTMAPDRVQYYKAYLKTFHRHLPQRFQHRVGTLSGGERQSLALALALESKPDLFLLDEHTSALDPNAASTLMHMTDRFIRSSGVTAVMTTHNIAHALDYGTRLIALKEGKLVLDVMAQERKAYSRADLLELYA